MLLSQTKEQAYARCALGFERDLAIVSLGPKTINRRREKTEDKKEKFPKGGAYHTEADGERPSWRDRKGGLGEGGTRSSRAGGGAREESRGGGGELAGEI